MAAVTGRALAAAATRAGRPVVVLDCFGDRETVALAQTSHAVARPGAWRFDRRALLRWAGRLAPPDRSAGLVYGSGFEDRPDLLRQLAAGRTLFGNPPDVLAAVKDPRRLFPLFDRLGIRYPAVRFTPPPDPGGWLVKRAGGAGGTHVRWATRRAVAADSHYQRFEEGTVCSALFLADGRQARLVGFNQQWTCALRPGRPFLYGGAVGGLDLPSPMAGDLVSRLDALVAATGLLGLNGLDFIRQGDAWLALEVNPRPTATMELHDPDYPRGLFDAHLGACGGEFPTLTAGPRPARAHANFLSPVAWEAGAEFSFPSWCRDLPQPGTVFAPGDPVCTVHAEGPDPAAAVRLIREREAAMSALIAAASPAGV